MEKMSLAVIIGRDGMKTGPSPSSRLPFSQSFKRHVMAVRPPCFFRTARGNRSTMWLSVRSTGPFGANPRPAALSGLGGLCRRVANRFRAGCVTDKAKEPGKGDFCPRGREDARGVAVGRNRHGFANREGLFRSQWALKP